jgi:hypothetical protein
MIQQENVSERKYSLSRLILIALSWNDYSPKELEKILVDWSEKYYRMGKKTKFQRISPTLLTLKRRGSLVRKLENGKYTLTRSGLISIICYYLKFGLPEELVSPRLKEETKVYLEYKKQKANISPSNK